MHFGRFVTFACGVIFGSLLQLWVLALMLNATNLPIAFPELLGNGGLFFFATSLAVGSALSLFDHYPVKIGSIDFLFTFFLAGPLMLVVVVYYTATMSNGGFGTVHPFKSYVTLQLGCSAMAMVYWFYSGLRTGLFVKKS